MELMRKLEHLIGIPVFFTTSPETPCQSFGTFPDRESPLVCTPELETHLIARSRRQDEPYVYRDDNKMYFACIKAQGGYYLTGPICMEELSYVELHRYYKTYNIPSTDERHPIRISLVKFLTFVSLLYEILEHKSIDMETLMLKNNLAEEKTCLARKEDVIMELRKIDDEIYHHTYHEERYVMDCVREGDTVHVMERIDALMESG